jgi:hypothetical protein
MLIMRVSKYLFKRNVHDRIFISENLVRDVSGHLNVTSIALSLYSSAALC